MPGEELEKSESRGEDESLALDALATVTAILGLTLGSVSEWMEAEEKLARLFDSSGELKMSSSVVCPAPVPMTPGCPEAMRTRR